MNSFNFKSYLIYFLFLFFISVIGYSQDSISIVNGTYLGNYQRNYYGNYIYNNLKLNWKLQLGSGETRLGENLVNWKGAGWTGQPLLYNQNGKLKLVIGSYDHHLKIINAENGILEWEYLFDDVIKGTGTLSFFNASNQNEELIIYQGSRQGLKNNLLSLNVFSFRSISLSQKKEVWRMNVPKGVSYSRDVDATPLIYNDTLYQPLENGDFYVINPFKKSLFQNSNFLTPEVLNSVHLYNEKDIKRQKANIVNEGSPALMRNNIFLSAGSGHVYRYNLSKRKIDWDFFIGTDLDGTPVVTNDSCLIVTVEKEYNIGKGGVYKLDPSLDANDKKCVKWFFPTGVSKLSNWKGGIIGSCGISDSYNNQNMAAIVGVDGFLYVINHREIDSNNLVLCPNNIQTYFSPKVLFKYFVGPSISTPIFTNDKLVVAGYNGLYLFNYHNTSFQLIDSIKGVFESTPVVDNGKLYIASRDGYLYCFGKERNDTLLSTSYNSALDSQIISKKDTSVVELFWIVKGSFNVKNNAYSFKKQLREKGFLTNVFFSNENHKYYVVLESFNNYDDANNYKTVKSKASELSDIWIKKVTGEF